MTDLRERIARALEPAIESYPQESGGRIAVYERADAVLAELGPELAPQAEPVARAEGLTPKEAWWAGARAALGIEYDTPRAEVASAFLRAAARAAAPQPQGPNLHPRTADLVQRFAAALAEKLAAAEAKYGYSDHWASPDWMDECRAKLVEHVAKGDPRDVAAYCAFLWHHGERTTAPQPQADRAQLVEAYNELLYAVVCKFPNETRHETALRYIRERESAEVAPAQSALAAAGVAE